MSTLLTLRQVSERYPALTENALRWLVRSRRIPIVRFSGNTRIYFDTGDLQRWIDEHKIPPVGNGGEAGKKSIG